MSVSLIEVKTRLPEYIKLVENTYKNTYTKALFIDKEFGEFWSLPKDVFRGHYHRKRGYERLSKLKTKNIDEIIKKLPAYLKIKENTFKNKHTKCVFIDSEYGEFQSTPKNILKGRGHPIRLKKSRKNYKLTIDDIKSRLPDYIKILDENKYINTSTKHKFLDTEYGEFINTAHEILQGTNHKSRAEVNRKKTNLLKYGVDHPSKDPILFSKMRSQMKKSRILKHWKTKNKINCTGSYEYNVVKYLNKNKIDFDWQIPFTLPNKTIYYCDLYLKKENKYVEIKGWWQQKVSKDKWEWFHKNYPNSELWDLSKLTQMKIPTRIKPKNCD